MTRLRFKTILHTGLTNSYYKSKKKGITFLTIKQNSNSFVVFKLFVSNIY